MPIHRILFIGLNTEEQRYMQRLLPEFDVETEPQFAASVEEALQPRIGGEVRLVVLRLATEQLRPDQGIRRLKRRLGSSIPVFLLIPQELASRVKTYFRAGADDFWVLPLDDVAFPTRFLVVIEWGQAMMRTTPRPATLEGGRSGLWEAVGGRLWNWLRRRLGSGESPVTVAPSTQNAAFIAARWEKVRRLGFGSFGEVWLVRPAPEGPRDGPAVAKIPHDAKLNTKFLREAAILRRLSQHDNAVHLKEIVKEAGRVVLIQEYIEGLSLQAHLEQGMDARTKERAFLQLLDVLAFAHQHKIMHRDIKPENIILTPDGVLKLLDFGTAKDLTRRSMSNTMIGSRPFMAPEQILGRSRLASDVWALGVILYALATESLPFYDENEKLLMDLILEAEPQRPSQLEPDLPLALEDIILKCLKKELAQRYGDAPALRAQILAAFPHFGDGSVLPPFSDNA